ncbi:MAG: sigma-E processing peptidase SpoIIGA [Lachnospiraceae bacterium]|nr:sigma-E processing peptidase SpoIIGA [Lachnospiraceae bacterium]
MYFEFYIDQFFAEQFITDYLLLALAGMLCRGSPPWPRLVCGSLAGAAGMTFSVCMGRPCLYGFSFLAAAVLALWRRDLKREWRYNQNCILWLLAVTVCFGGVLTALWQLLPFPIMACAGLAFAVTSAMLRAAGHQCRISEQQAVVTLFWEGRSVVLDGFLDTGNQLAEPVTGYPVSIADQDALAGLLTEAWEEKHGFCLIPYHSLGARDGWMRGVSLDEMQVTMRQTSRTVSRPVIALYDGRVSARRDYQILLHPEHAP